MLALNEALFHLINATSDAGPALVWLARLLAEQAIWLVPGVLVVGWLRGAEANRRALLEAAIAGVAALAIAQFIATVWPHPRPFMLGLGTNFLVHAADGSFPSDHLTLIWAVAFSLLASRRQWRVGMALAALGLPVAWARIYLGVHFPLDMVGAALVAGVGVGLCRIARRWLVDPIYEPALRLHRLLFAAAISRGWVR